MSLGWIIYFIGILDNIIGLLCVPIAISGGITFVLGIVYFLMWLDDNERLEGTWNKTKKYFINLIISFIILIGIVTFIPSSKLVATIYLLPKIVENEEVQKIPNNALKLLNSKMEEWIEDLVIEKERTEQ